MYSSETETLVELCKICILVYIKVIDSRERWKLLIDANIAAQVFKEPENRDHMNICIKSDEWTNIYTRKVSICTVEWETTSDEIRGSLKLENII